MNSRLCLKGLVILGVLGAFPCVPGAWAQAINGMQEEPQGASDYTDREASFMPQVVAAPTPAPTPAPAVLPAATPVTSAALPAVAKPVDMAAPVEAAQLADVDPQSIGLLSAPDGGLGSGLWKGTSRAFLERMLPTLSLPTASATLNSLAQRFLLTITSVPTGNVTSKQSLVAMRIDRLLALGDITNALKLASLAKPELIDDITWRQVTETALATNTGDMCGRLPTLMKSNAGGDWQQILVVCQLRANDNKAAQLSLDLMHSQGVKDETFFGLAEKTIIGGAKSLPRQLTPLKPITMALLQLAQRPLPGELYARAPAVLVPGLLQMKSGREETPRLNAAERAAAAGIISETDLAAVYNSLTFPADLVADPAGASTMDAAHKRALFYQAALKETQPDKHVALVLNYYRALPPALAEGNIMRLLAGLLDPETASVEHIKDSAAIARIYLMANKTNAAMEWLKIARSAAGNPDVVAELASLWPLIALSNLETDTKFAANLAAWIDSSLKQSEARVARERVASVLMILSAAGFAVADDVWVRVADAPSFDKRLLPSPLFIERLRDAGVGGRRGEVVLLGLSLNGGGDGVAAIPPVVETVRALRLVGLTADAMALAREAVSVVLAAPAALPLAKP